MYLFNARAEGDRNNENNEFYSGAKGIITKPSFRKPIRSQRCLVIADAFYEGSKKEKFGKNQIVCNNLIISVVKIDLRKLNSGFTDRFESIPVFVKFCNKALYSFGGAAGTITLLY